MALRALLKAISGNDPSNDDPSQIVREILSVLGIMSVVFAAFVVIRVRLRVLVILRLAFALETNHTNLPRIPHDMPIFGIVFNSLKVLHVISWFERALEQLLVHVEGKVLICVVLALLYFVSMYAFCSKSRRPAFVALNA